MFANFHPSAACHHLAQLPSCLPVLPISATLQSINNFCLELGVTRSEGEVHLHKLDHHIRADLDVGSRRTLGVLRPLRLVITNLPEEHFEEVEAKVGGRL